MILSLEEIIELLGKAEKGDNTALQRCEAMCKHWLNKHPRQAMVIAALGRCYLMAGQTGLAIVLLEQAASLASDSPDLWNTLGVAYRKAGHIEWARTAFNKSLNRKRDSNVLCNLGATYLNCGRPIDAMWSLESAVEMNPENHSARWNLGIALLEQEIFDLGFEQYAYGVGSGHRLLKHYGDAQMWDGEPNEVVAVWGEQGVGDEVMFASCLPDLAARSKHVVFDCHPRLVNVFKRSFAHIPNLSFYPTRKIYDPLPWVSEVEKEHGPIRYKLPVGSLPKFFRRAVEDFPGTAYLSPKPELVELYKAKIQALGAGPYIGISLFGGHKMTGKEQRCIKPSIAAPLLELGATFISLEYQDRIKDYAGFAVHHWPEVTQSTYGEWWEAGGKRVRTKEEAVRIGGKIIQHPGPAFDLDHHIALIAAIEALEGMVISVNNSTVHFAGALGAQCVTLTPSTPAWRYGQTRSDMVWYKSVLQIRQTADNWDEVIEKLLLKLGMPKAA